MSKFCVASRDAGLTKWKKAGVDQCSGRVQILMREGNGGEGGLLARGLPGLYVTIAFA